MKPRFVLLVVAVSAGLLACASGEHESTATAADQARCQALVGTRVGVGTIESAEPVERGAHVIGFVRRMILKFFVGRSMPDLAVPADFCRVTAKLQPVEGSNITAEVWLPNEWNGKVLAIGGGGFNGGLSTAAIMLKTPLGRGYAGIATDAGHKDTDSAKFTREFPEQYVDYAYRANHVAAGFVKELAANYYGSAVQRAYFHGCSNGGRDALMEARKFPEDYDGIIAGAPAAGWSKLMTSFAWNAQAVRTAPTVKKKLKLVHEVVIAQCDALDGVKDQFLENPMMCPFDPSALQCKQGDGADCLTTAEVEVLRRLYEGPRLGDGTKVYAGMPVGGEGLENNWDSWLMDEKGGQAAFAREAFRWMVYGDPEWSVDRFDIDRDYPAAKENMGPIMDSDDPDLSAFVGRGGRLLLYHGWNDAAIPAGATLDYYAEVRERLGPAADEHVRLFMVPGMGHCFGGVGPNYFDLLDAIDRWVETGVAPEQITASEYDPPVALEPAPRAKLVRTRPLCAWPKTAHYNGWGSTDDAANFTCREPESAEQ